MALLAVQDIIENGLTAAYTAATAAGDTFKNDGRAFIHVKNGGPSAIDVTVTVRKQDTSLAGFGGVKKSPQALNIGAGAEGFVGPFPEQAFNDGAQLAEVTYSADTSVTVAALRLPAAA